jgi:hypothetical protein
MNGENSVTIPTGYTFCFGSKQPRRAIDTAMVIKKEGLYKKYFFHIKISFAVYSV